MCEHLRVAIVHKLQARDAGTIGGKFVRQRHGRLARLRHVRRVEVDRRLSWVGPLVIFGIAL